MADERFPSLEALTGVRDVVSPTVRRLSVETGVCLWEARTALVARGWDYERALSLVLASLALGRSVADMVGAERDIKSAEEPKPPEGE